MYIKYLCLNSRLEEYEFMSIQLNIISEEIILLCDLREITNQDGFVCIEIQGGTHGLPQYRRLAFNYLVKN